MRNNGPPGFQNNYSRQALPQTSSEFDELKTLVKGLAMSQKALENHIGQIANNITNRPQGGFPSNTEANPRSRGLNNEQINAIGLRFGKFLEEVVANEVEPSIEHEKVIEFVEPELCEAEEVEVEVTNSQPKKKFFEEVVEKQVEERDEKEVDPK